MREAKEHRPMLIEDAVNEKAEEQGTTAYQLNYGLTYCLTEWITISIKPGNVLGLPTKIKVSYIGIPFQRSLLTESGGKVAHR